MTKSLGFWAAVHDVWPRRASSAWFHKLGNIQLPKRRQPRVKAALHEVMYAETRDQAREAITRFAPKCPKAVTTVEKDADVLLTMRARGRPPSRAVHCTRVV